MASNKEALRLVKQMMDAGMTLADINNAYQEQLVTIEREKKMREEAAAKAKERQDEIAAARRMYKKAHAKYMEAITGEPVSEEEIAAFEKEVLNEIEAAYARIFNPLAEMERKLNKILKEC
jgi:hypothetical protein